ncbi:MAG: hypothetical protein AAF936_13015 [Pseudomonadota bacterium]
MPDQDGTPAITLAAIDPYAIPGWSSSDIVSPDGRAPAPPLPEPEERPPLDYDVRLVAYMDCLEGDAVERGGAARFDDFCAMLLTLCPHGRLRSRQFLRGDDDGPLDLPVRLLVDMHCLTADADAELCEAFHDFYRGLLGLYPTAELFCRRYDRIRFEDPDWLRW